MTPHACVVGRGRSHQVLVRGIILAAIACEAGVLVRGWSRESPPPALPLDARSPAVTDSPATARLPAFTDYPVDDFLTGPPAPPDLTSPQAQMIRTRLRNGASKGPNFAGHYTVVTWGCGTNCQMLAIVDARTGRVFYPGVVSEVGFGFRLDSALLIENPLERFDEACPGMQESRKQWYIDLFGGPNYYRWNGATLELISGDETAMTDEPGWAR